MVTESDEVVVLQIQRYDFKPLSGFGLEGYSQSIQLLMSASSFRLGAKGSWMHHFFVCCSLHKLMYLNYVNLMEY